MGGVPDPRAHLADRIVQFKFISLAKQLMAWSLVKRRPWIQLLWQSVIDVVPAFFRSVFCQGGQARTLDPEEILQSALGWRFGSWMSMSTSGCGYRLAGLTSPAF